MAVDAARLYAEKKHGGARRRSGLAIEHVAEVVKILESVGVADDATLATAWLHDTIEDTDTGYDSICDRFGAGVADAVSALSKDRRLPADAREAEYLQRLRTASDSAKTVKFADILANLGSMAESGDDAAKLQRKAARLRRYLGAIHDGVDPDLPGVAAARSRMDQLLRLRGFEPVR